MDQNHLKDFERGPTKDHSCEVWSKSNQIEIVLGFNTLVGHFVSSPREREKRDRRDSRRDEKEGQGRKRNGSESEEMEETRIPRKASSHLLAQKSQEPQSECGY